MVQDIKVKSFFYTFQNFLLKVSEVYAIFFKIKNINIDVIKSAINLTTKTPIGNENNINNFSSKEDKNGFNNIKTKIFA